MAVPSECFRTLSGPSPKSTSGPPYTDKQITCTRSNKHSLPQYADSSIQALALPITPLPPASPAPGLLTLPLPTGPWTLTSMSATSVSQAKIASLCLYSAARARSADLRSRTTVTPGTLSRLGSSQGVVLADSDDGTYGCFAGENRKSCQYQVIWP